MKKAIHLAVLIITSLTGYSQIVSHDFYNFRLDNMYSINPAYTGESEGTQILLNARSQTNGVQFANKNFMGGVHSKISNTQALGAKIAYDSRGAFQVFNAELTYSYSLKINTNQYLNFGINAGVLKTDFVPTRIENQEALDWTDEELANPYFNSLQFTSGFGLLYRFKELEISVSTPSLLSTNTDLLAYLNTSAFYTIKANKKWSIQPWVNYQNIPFLDPIIGGYVKTTYNNSIWVQGGYQTNQAILASVGFKWENFSLGYGFTINNSAYSNIAKGVNEVVMKYNFISGKNKGTSLSDIIDELNELNNTEVTPDNKEELKQQLKKIKQQLIKVEIDNQDPKNAKKIKQELMEINQMLDNVENKLNR